MARVPVYLRTSADWIAVPMYIKCGRTFETINALHSSPVMHTVLNILSRLPKNEVEHLHWTDANSRVHTFEGPDKVTTSRRLKELVATYCKANVDRIDGINPSRHGT